MVATHLKLYTLKQRKTASHKVCIIKLHIRYQTLSILDNTKLSIENFNSISLACPLIGCPFDVCKDHKCPAGNACLKKCCKPVCEPLLKRKIII